ncbi:hypothetical protein [Arthrobacter sp. zg-Y1110]|uniref:hypothetical protein n=1 Tax=Arthrobacter sp. zg-Y1110 TaxID=2886932 RepID=UPI001D15A8DD|nr:hypothetical protein [Arthrobacter sp. zg-Y1110]MCC3292878.1 hypothetical protein [Arthrobacter sp. zg-Y1110]UWX86816.1 hypothetical protein N2K99_18410 [Arthrobacter sp. zg-Y1110]
MPSMKDLPCAVCGTTLEPVESDLPDQPYGANIFTTSGHYGATAFDSPGGDRLELLICTACMKSMAERQAIHRVLDATEQTPEQTLVWGSDAEQAISDTPMNALRLANMYRLEAVEEMPGMTVEKYHEAFRACAAASAAGRVFSP